MFPDRTPRPYRIPGGVVLYIEKLDTALRICYTS